MVQFCPPPACRNPDTGECMTPKGIPCNPDNGSPEEGCIRYVSNENTLPAPLVFPWCCRRVHEHSWVARKFGNVGFSSMGHPDRRRPLLLTAFGVSFTAWVFMMLASGALSTGQSLNAWAWAIAEIRITPGTTVTLRAGIWARTATFYSTDYQPPLYLNGIGGWADCADAISMGEFNLTFDDPTAHCTDCADVSESTTLFIILSIVTQISQISSDVQRSTRYGDINCQKLWAVLTSTFGFVTGIQSLRTFAFSCWRNLPSTYTVLLPGGLPITVEAEWTGSVGFFLMAIGISLKAFDVFCHLIVPTPQERRIRPPEKVDMTTYMKLEVQSPAPVYMQREEGEGPSPVASQHSLQETRGKARAPPGMPPEANASSVGNADL